MNKTSPEASNATQGAGADLNQTGKALLILQIMQCKD